MKLKNTISKLLVLAMVGSTFAINIQDVQAIDFSKDESKYMTLCSSTNITSSNKSTCEEFNAYLKEKSSKLNEELSKQKENASKTATTLEDVQKELEKINDSVIKLQEEINYINTTIANLEAAIEKNSQLIKERMYVMQSYMNDDSYISYIFGATDFTDMISRIDSYNALTQNDRDLIEQTAAQISEVNTQKETLQTNQTALVMQQSEQESLQTRYTALLEEQQNQVASTTGDIAATEAASAELDAALSQAFEEGQKSDVGYVAPLPAPEPTPAPTPTPTPEPTPTPDTTPTPAPTPTPTPTPDSGSSSGGNESSSSAATGVAIANAALAKQGCRYYWGAQGPTYFDCSGLVYWSLKQAGVSGGRKTAAGYSSSGKSVSRANLQVGDVITFNYGSGVAHIGIYIGNNNMVHASGKGSGTVGQYPDQCVKVSSLSGYYGKYIHNYRRLY